MMVSAWHSQQLPGVPGKPASTWRTDRWSSVSLYMTRYDQVTSRRRPSKNESRQPPSDHTLHVNFELLKWSICKSHCTMHWALLDNFLLAGVLQKMNQVSSCLSILHMSIVNELQNWSICKTNTFHRTGWMILKSKPCNADNVESIK